VELSTIAAAVRPAIFSWHKVTGSRGVGTTNSSALPGYSGVVAAAANLTMSRAALNLGRRATPGQDRPSPRVFAGVPAVIFLDVACKLAPSSVFERVARIPLRFAAGLTVHWIDLKMLQIGEVECVRTVLECYLTCTAAQLVFSQNSRKVTP
jgi:hypothetical protein